MVAKGTRSPEGQELFCYLLMCGDGGGAVQISPGIGGGLAAALTRAAFLGVHSLAQSASQYPNIRD